MTMTGGRSLLLAAALAVHAGAYNPPQDTAGSLTVRIEGPATIASATQPVNCTVVLINAAAGPAIRSGELRLEVHRGWQTEPAAPQGFSLDPGETKRVQILLRPDPAAHGSAHYPLHAFASHTAADGKRLTAHPILILETRFASRQAAPPPPEWRATAPAANSTLALWRLKRFRAVYRVFSAPAPVTMPTAWQGTEPESRANLAMTTRVTRGTTREAITMHPPWFNGQAGTMWVEFPVLLPRTEEADSPLQIRFANAVRDPDPGVRPGDGVTFRVRVAPMGAPDGTAGEVVFERHSDSKAWLDGVADLRRFAGQAVRLQLESHPGPANNTSFDSSYWAEPTLVMGVPTVSGLSAPKQMGSLAGYRISAQTGSRGLLNGRVTFEPVEGGTPLWFDGFSVRVAGDQLDDGRTPTVFRGFSEEVVFTGGATAIRHKFEEFDLMIRLAVEDGMLKAGVWLENGPKAEPWRATYIEDLAVNPWSAAPVKVFAGAGNVLVEPEAFQLRYDGHRLSTSFVGFEFAGGISIVQAVDTPPTELDVDPRVRRATIRTAHPTLMTLVPSADVWSAAKTWREANGLTAAPGVPKLAGRFVFDLWGGRYANAARDLARASLYGLTDAAVVWHNWQRWGYDYRLPDIFPPNPALGTEAEFSELAAAAKQHGRLFALHDNYIDLYPDAPGFDYSQVSHSNFGTPVRAWLNESRQAQSYRWLTGAWQPWVESNLRQLKESVSPTAYFIDVWSSVGPYESWSYKGDFIDRLETARSWGDTFAWIRDYLGEAAPQISESGHDALIGKLDGAQTNHLRVDNPPEGEYSWAVWNIRAKEAERIPWFDFAHHDKFVLHGAGYEPRYSSGLDARLHGIYSDDYITTEFLTGHPAMAKDAFSRDTVRKYWLSQDVSRALAMRRIERVELADGNIHRMRVVWEGGGEVVVNRGETDHRLTGGRILPSFGLYARIPAAEGDGPAVEAAIERRDGGIIAEWSRSKDQLYVNARPPISNRLDLRVKLDSLECATPRRCTYTFRWEAGEPTPEPLRVFVHFTDAAGAIRFQGDHVPSQPTNTWRGTVFTRVTVDAPAQFDTGSRFDLMIGLYSPNGGQRFVPEGPADGSGRIQLGAVTLGAQAVTFEEFVPPPDRWLERVNPERKLIAFPYGVTTNSAFRLSPGGDSLWLTPLPNSRAAEVQLRWEELPWRLPRPTSWIARDESGRVLSTGVFPSGAAAEPVTLPLAAGVFAYELRP